MTQLFKKEGNYRAGEKEPDFTLEMKLRQYITARPQLLDPEVQLLFKRLHGFAHHVQSAGFDQALKNLSGDVDCSGTPELTELIAENLCQGMHATGSAMEGKSLQETLYFCTGIVPELRPAEFGKRLESFITLSGSKGLIRIFLSTHLSNLIFTNLRDLLNASPPDVLGERTEAIERICRKAAVAAVRSLSAWSEPDESAVAIVLVDLNTEMARMVGSRVSSHH